MSGMAEFNTVPDSTWRDIPATAADSAADMASDAVDTVTSYASRAQSAVTSYFRDHDAKDMLDDLTSYVKSHPTQALLAAAAVGFVTAALLRRR